jgi:hypothetical protein
MYGEIYDLVKENLGLTKREIAEKLGRKTEYGDPLLWRLREHTGAACWRMAPWPGTDFVLSSAGPRV